MTVSHFMEAHMSERPRLNLDELERKQSANHKYCEHCGSPIPRSFELPYCASCQDTFLFKSVKEYIRNNNVNEFQVAEHFDIPLSLVKRWVREMRIEYSQPGFGPKIK